MISIRRYGCDYKIGRYRIIDTGEGIDGHCWAISPDSVLPILGPVTFKAAVDHILGIIPPKTT